MHETADSHGRALMLTGQAGDRLLSGPVAVEDRPRFFESEAEGTARSALHLFMQVLCRNEPPLNKMFPRVTMVFQIGCERRPSSVHDDFHGA